MNLATFPTPDGPFTVLAATGVVLASGWTDSTGAILERIRPADRPAKAVTVAATDADFVSIRAAIQAYYDGEVTAIDQVPVRQFGSDLQLLGWGRLRTIRPGDPLSYAEFAAALGRPRAVRATASICARNAPALFVPCHRVLRGDGSLGGFAWGSDVKRSLLAREAR